MKDILKYCLS